MFWKRKRPQSDFSEELQAHLALETDRLREEGLSEEEARAKARRSLGNITKANERYYESHRCLWLDYLWQDLRFGLRQLRRNPGFTAVAVITLAIGIGANTAIFSMMNGVLLRSLPYHQPKRLYSINEVVPQWSRFAHWFAVNSGNFLLWQRACPGFSSMALIMEEKYNLTGEGLPRQVRTARVSANFFPMLGIRPELGRSFLPQEDQQGRDHEAILTHRFWQKVFNSNPRIIGKAINLSGTSFTVVGVLPESFRFPKVLNHAPDLFKPIGFQNFELHAGVYDFNYTVIARLAPGVSPKQALAQLNVVEARIAKKDGRGFSLYAMLTPLKTVIVGPAAKALWMLVMAAAVVLLIICVNLANLMLVRNTSRAHETAVRSALGATRGRLARQLLTEAFILAAAGGGLGLLVASLGLDLLVRRAPLGIPRVSDIRIDPLALWFTLAVSVIAALLFSLLPALGLARVRPAEALKSAGPAASGARQAARLRGGLVIGEIALCVVLLAGALLLIESLAHVVRANNWMDQQHVLAASLIAPPNEYPTSAKLDQFYSSVVEKVRNLPGVRSAGLTSSLPLSGDYWGDDIEFREAPRPPGNVKLGEFAFVSPGYFSTVGLPLVKGRLLSESDRGKDVALISQSVARRVLNGRNPIGMHLVWRSKAREVIGVVSNVRTAPDKPSILGVYLPIWSYARGEETLLVRTGMDPLAAAPAIRRAIWSVDPQVAIPREETLKTIVQASIAPRRYETSLAAILALVAVLLAALGVYGVISYSVSQRTHEIGIRMALGARKSDLLRLVVGKGMILALTGVGIGIVAALGLTRFFASMLYGVTPADPATYLVIVLLLTGVALVACYIPARRATQVEPMVALRHE